MHLYPICHRVLDALKTNPDGPTVDSIALHAMTTRQSVITCISSLRRSGQLIETAYRLRSGQDTQPTRQELIDVLRAVCDGDVRRPLARARGLEVLGRVDARTQR